MKKINPKYIALIIVIILLCFLSWCHGRSGVKTVIVKDKIDSTIALKAEIKQSGVITTNRDTRVIAGKDTIVKVEIRYKTKIVEIIKTAPDTCNPFLIAMINEAQIVDSAKNAQIARQDSNITDFKIQIQKLNKVVVMDSTDKAEAKKEAEKTAKAEFKRGKRVGRKQGAIITGAVLGAIYVGSKVKP